jgi:hypothetical protein
MTGINIADTLHIGALKHVWHRNAGPHADGTSRIFGIEWPKRQAAHP